MTRQSDPDGPDRGTARAAVAVGARAPSVHNSQPWRWRIGRRRIQLHVDMGRWLPLTDTDGRDLLLSCGAALHHLRVGLTAMSAGHTVDRLPDPERPDLLAAVTLRPGRGQATPGVATTDVTAVERRRTDRRPYVDWPIPPGHLDELTRRAAEHGALLRVVTDVSARRVLAEAAAAAAAEHDRTPGYDTELALWTGWPAGPDGIPARSVPAGPTGGGIPPRRFAHARPAVRDAGRPDGATLLVLGTSSDDELSQLRAGEALSAVLLGATTLGLAGCPLSEPLEVPGTRALVRDTVLGGSVSPQIVLRLGWPADTSRLPQTPRRPLDDQVDIRRD